MSSHEIQKLDRRHATMRKIVLGVILLALVAALAYDYGVARRQVDDAFDLLATRFEEANATASRPFTNEDVRDMLGKQPARAFTDGSEKVEVFSWISGLPFRTHDLYVVYATVPNSEETFFIRHSKFAYTRSDELAHRSPAELAGEGGNDFPDTGRRFRVTSVGDGGPSRGDAVDADNEAAMAPQSSEPTIAATSDSDEVEFDELDADHDGQLLPSELPDRLREGWGESDLDGDGKIALEEFRLIASRHRDDDEGR